MVSEFGNPNPFCESDFSKRHKVMVGVKAPTLIHPDPPGSPTDADPTMALLPP